MTAAPRYRCHTCGAEFTSWAASERHSDAERHHRIDHILSSRRETK